MSSFLFAELPEPRFVTLKQRRLRKTIKDWEDENNARWRVGLGLPEEDDIGLLFDRPNGGEVGESKDTGDDENEDEMRMVDGLVGLWRGRRIS